MLTYLQVGVGVGITVRQVNRVIVVRKRYVEGQCVPVLLLVPVYHYMGDLVIELRSADEGRYSNFR